MRTILVTRCSQQFGGSWGAKIPTVVTTPHASLNLPIQQRAEHIKPYRLSTVVVGAGSRHVQVDHSRRWPTLNYIAHVSKRHLHSTAPRYANANRPTQSDRTRHCKKCDSTIRPNAEHNQVWSKGRRKTSVDEEGEDVEEEEEQRNRESERTTHTHTQQNTHTHTHTQTHTNTMHT